MTRRTAALVIVVALGLAACTGGDDGASDDGDGSTTSAAVTTPPPDFSGVGLPRVAGTTSTTGIVATGAARLRGTVQGPDGPVPAATVRLVRLAGGQQVATQVVTDEAGAWEVAGAGGGAYLVRAWRPPDLAMAEPVGVFLTRAEDRVVVLELTALGGPAVSAAIAPSPADVGSRQQLAVNVVLRRVDGEGVAQASPLNGAYIRLNGGSRWDVEGDDTTMTDGSGRAMWVVRCRSAGQQALSVTVLVPKDALAVAEPVPATSEQAFGGPTVRPVAQTSTSTPSSTTSTTAQKPTTTSTSSTTTTTTIPLDQFEARELPLQLPDCGLPPTTTSTPPAPPVQ